MSGSGPRTVAQAIEDAVASTNTGYRFISEDSDAEPFFTHGGIERASARFGGALQAMGLGKGERLGRDHGLHVVTKAPCANTCIISTAPFDPCVLVVSVKTTAFRVRVRSLSFFDLGKSGHVP